MDRVRVTLLAAPIIVKFHLKALLVVLHVTSSLSPARHTAALGEGDIITAPV